VDLLEDDRAATVVRVSAEERDRILEDPPRDLEERVPVHRSISGGVYGYLDVGIPATRRLLDP
jgi:hypothetical protein